MPRSRYSSGRPPKRPPSTGPQPPKGLYELDAFTEANLRQWTRASDDLEELQQQLHYGTEPQRNRLRPELLEAIKLSAGSLFLFENWYRLVTYQFSNTPLSAEGSLVGIGGRFNVGRDLKGVTTHPSWPALYLGEDHDTAFFEKYQMKVDEARAGLTPQDFALTPNGSHTAVRVRGQLSAVFRITSPQDLVEVARVLRKVKMPERVRELERRLFGRSARPAHIISSPQELFRVLLAENWRVLPMQFDIPARTQVIAELVRAAGFEAIVYKSTKGLKNCMAVFLDQLRDGSYIELQDRAPSTVLETRIDPKT